MRIAKVWLLEVNSSPDCSHATPVLTRICDHAHRHLFHLMLGASETKGAAMEGGGGAADGGAAAAVTSDADAAGEFLSCTADISRESCSQFDSLLQTYSFDAAAAAVTSDADDGDAVAPTAGGSPPSLPPTPPAADATPYDFVAAAAAASDVSAGAEGSGPRWRLVHQAGAALTDAEIALRKAAMDRVWFDSEWQRQCGGAEGGAAAAEGSAEGSGVSAKLEEVIAELFPGAGKTAVVVTATEASKTAEVAAADADSSDEEL